MRKLFGIVFIYKCAAGKKLIINDNYLFTEKNSDLNPVRQEN